MIFPCVPSNVCFSSEIASDSFPINVISPFFIMTFLTFCPSPLPPLAVRTLPLRADWLILSSPVSLSSVRGELS